MSAVLHTEHDLNTANFEIFSYLLQVPVCLTCGGDIGFEEALVYCFKCEDCALHSYLLLTHCI